MRIVEYPEGLYDGEQHTFSRTAVSIACNVYRRGGRGISHWCLGGGQYSIRKGREGESPLCVVDAEGWQEEVVFGGEARDSSVWRGGNRW